MCRREINPIFFFLNRFCFVNKATHIHREDNFQEIKNSPTCLVYHVCVISDITISSPHLHATIMAINPERPHLQAPSSMLPSPPQPPVYASLLLLSFQLATERKLSEKYIHAVNMINDKRAMFRFGVQ